MLQKSVLTQSQQSILPLLLTKSELSSRVSHPGSLSSNCTCVPRDAFFFPSQLLSAGLSVLSGNLQVQGSARSSSTALTIILMDHFNSPHFDHVSFHNKQSSPEAFLGSQRQTHLALHHTPEARILLRLSFQGYFNPWLHKFPS